MFWQTWLWSLDEDVVWTLGVFRTYEEIQHNKQTGILLILNPPINNLHKLLYFGFILSDFQIIFNNLQQII